MIATETAVTPYTSDKCDIILSTVEVNVYDAQCNMHKLLNHASQFNFLTKKACKLLKVKTEPAVWYKPKQFSNKRPNYIFYLGFPDLKLKLNV